MKIKLDENFDPRLVPVLQSHGLDVDTILAERLSGSPDEVVYATCQTLGRVLITLDLDFSNPFRFPPGDTEGIVVVRPPRPVLPAIRATLLSVLPQLKTLPLKGTLWIVEPGRIRFHDPDEPLDAS
jgi:predicted nuclease of predicted toxin-antitoxin system